MTTKGQHFQGADGVALSTVNTGGVSGDFLNAVPGTGAAPTFSAAAALRGTSGMSAAAASGSTSIAELGPWAATSLSGRFYLLAATPAADTEIYQARTAAGRAFGLTYTAAGQLKVVDGAGASAGTLTPTLTPGTWYRVEYQGTSDAAAGTIAVQLYAGDSLVALASVSQTNRNTRGGTITVSRLGKASGSTATAPFLFASWRDVDGSTTPVGVAPIANAGPDVTLEPYASATLNSTGSSAPGSSISSLQWTKLADSTTSSGATKTVTAAATRTGSVDVYALQVRSAALSALGPPDYVIVTTLKHRRFKIGGGPVRFRRL